MSRPHCTVCGRWDGTHSTGCEGGFYVGVLVACPQDARFNHRCAACQGLSAEASLRQARALRSGAVLGTVHPDYEISQPELGGRYNVDRENDLRTALAESSRADAQLLFDVFSAARDATGLSSGVSPEQWARFDALYDEIRMRLDQLDALAESHRGSTQTQGGGDA